jgi:galactokinase
MNAPRSANAANMDPRELAIQHQQRCGAAGAMFRAPGRVNLIGEHTDYSGGLILPAAIDFSTLAIISPRDDRQCVIYSDNFSKQVVASLDQFPPKGTGDWSDYPLGVASVLREKGIDLPGFDLTIAGDVPLGAGLSSSASIEVATAFALLSLTKRHISLEEIALLCQLAENTFVGANCGIMDQFIACFGEKDHAVLVDTRSLGHTPVPIPPDVQIVICNSMVKHSHAGGEYNTRRAEVDEGSRILREHDSKIRELRDATIQDLESVRSQMPENVYRRCRHIITENDRVEQTVAAFKAGDLAKVGKLMAASHASYRDDFEASVPEVDALIQIAAMLPGLIGARLTGGGFGGCTVNLVEAAHAAAFSTAIHDEYKERLKIDAEVYRCHASAGAGPVAQPFEV